jgi:hypothetical protein
VGFLLTLTEQFHLQKRKAIITPESETHRRKTNLSVSDDPDNFAVSFHGPQLLFDDFLAQIILPFL